MRVSPWQDVLVSDEEHAIPAGASSADGSRPPTPANSSEVRSVSDVDTLKAMADPLRLAILAALMEPAAADLRVMSVKELAEELGEPQTKLYRHVKQLEVAGLIRVAASRLVSGILEQRYQANQRDVRFGPELLRDKAMADESEPLVTAMLDRYRSTFLAAQRAALIAPDDYPPDQAYRRPMMLTAETRVSPRRAATIRAKLLEIVDELDAADAHDSEGVPVSVLIGFHSPAAPAGN
jgi:DNA-binding transcriptional ArsR family regulator